MVPKGPKKMRNYKWQLKASLIPKGWKVPKGPERMRNYKWMLKTWAGSKRLKGMRDLKEDMYNSDIWFGMPGLGDRKIWRQRRDSGRRHKVTRYNCHDCTNTNITKIPVTRLHKRPRMSGDGWILCWKSFILSVEFVTIWCGYDLIIYQYLAPLLRLSRV